VMIVRVFMGVFLCVGELAESVADRSAAVSASGRRAG
jgi:hypothetical protein